MPSRRKVTDELRERLAEVVHADQLDDVMTLLDEYEIKRKGVDIINMVMGPPPQQQVGFSRWNLEEAYAEGLRRGRSGR